MDEIFQIQLDKESEVPMYRQLADAIGALAADGLLPFLYSATYGKI